MKSTLQKSLIIGLLALQGDFAKHTEMFWRLGVKTKEVRKPDDLKQCDGFIIPGGESTVLSKLIDLYDLRAPILKFAKTKPILGTCAGAILLSKNANDERVNTFGIIDISVRRNAYGRQIDSFSAFVKINEFQQNFEAIFIRAPQISSLPATENGGIQILAEYNNQPIFVRQKNILALTFHPELTQDSRVHEYFLKMI